MSEEEMNALSAGMLTLGDVSIKIKLQKHYEMLPSISDDIL